MVWCGVVWCGGVGRRGGIFGLWNFQCQWVMAVRFRAFCAFLSVPYVGLGLQVRK